jgi:hypothetical protein
MWGYDPLLRVFAQQSELRSRTAYYIESQAFR